MLGPVFQMWVDKFIEKYQYTTEDIDVPEVEKPAKEFECDIERLSKILPSNYFNIDLYREEPVDNAFLRRKGLIFLLVSSLMFLVTLYMLYHCHKASCGDCLENLDRFPCDSCTSLSRDHTPSSFFPLFIPHKFLTYLQHSDVNTCSLNYCVYNNFWNPSTHYEKCYYSSLCLNTFLWFLAMKVFRWLATECFRHSLPAVIPED